MTCAAAPAIALVAVLAACTTDASQPPARSATPNQPAASSAPASALPSPSASGAPASPSAPAHSATAAPAATPSTGDAGSPAAFRPTVTTVDWQATLRAVEASGFVDGIVEDGGQCVFTLTLGGATAEQKSAGVAAGTTTSCGWVDIPTSRHGAGSVTLTYRATDGSAATSQAVTVTVP